MAIVLDATAAGTDSNTYSTLAEAETYFESRLHKTDWSGETDADKNIALVWATRLLDEQVDWVGVVWDDDQALRWPRSSVVDADGRDVTYDTIPQFLKDATAELAMHLLAGDRVDDDDTRGFEVIQVGPIKLKINPFDRTPILPPSVWSLIGPYGIQLRGVARVLERV